MKVLVVGSGGREHAITWKLSQSRSLKQLYCAPGNPGTEAVSENVLMGVDQFQEIRRFCRSQRLDLIVVGPEVPLVGGLSDMLVEDGFRVVGPSQKAAQLEGSKIFAKEFMKRHGIPTAPFRIFDEPEAAKEHVNQLGRSIVIKADGLAAGKGVILPRDATEARNAIDRMMIAREFGDAGNRVLIEERLQGEEASLLLLVDGKNVLPLSPAQDHKRVFDGDEGPNTGGMGAYSPTPVVTEEGMRRVRQEVVDRIRLGFEKDRLEFRGVLYIGLMWTAEGPRVLEFNVRFGDPETQAILPRLKADFAEMMMATAEGSLSDIEMGWADEWTVCVVLASGGYPGKFSKGLPIEGVRAVSEMKDVDLFHAGTEWEGTKLVTSGGRVLNVVARGETLQSAIDLCYSAVSRIHFDKMHYRTDIGRRALSMIS